MQYKPHEYQAYAKDFILEHPEAALLLDMGLGKTVITLTAIHELILDRFEISKALVVAPLRVARDTWPTELRKWDHLEGLTMSVIIGTPAQREAALAAPADIYVINRENLVWLAARKPSFDLIVLDEMSSFKDRSTARFKAALKLRASASRVIGLTGTPTPNGLLDLWAQYRILDHGLRLGKTITGYRQAFFEPDKRSAQQIFSWKPRPGAPSQIHALIEDCTVSMSSNDYLHLPELTEVTHQIALGATETAFYGELRAELILWLHGEEIEATNAAVLSGKLQQLASGAIYGDGGQPILVHDAKMDKLDELIEATNGKPVLVAYWFKHEKERIQQRFPQARCLDTSADIADWNNGQIELALIHPASAGHGLNLQAGGSTLIWFTAPWSLELYQQTNARLHRQGQSEPVIIHHLVVKDTIDEQTQRSLGAKDLTQAALIEAVKANLGKDPA